MEGFFSGTQKVRLLAPGEIAANIDLSMTTCWLLIPLKEEKEKFFLLNPNVPLAPVD